MNLLKIRKRNNYTLEDIAKLLGVTSQTVSNWENGKPEPSIDNLKQLSNYFNVSIDYLVGNTTRMTFDDLVEKIKELDQGQLTDILTSLLVSLKKD